MWEVLLSADTFIFLWVQSIAALTLNREVSAARLEDRSGRFRKRPEFARLSSAATGDRFISAPLSQRSSLWLLIKCLILSRSKWKDFAIRCSFFVFFSWKRRWDNYPKWILHEWRDKRAALIPSSSTANTEQMNLTITIGHWINSPNGNWCDFSWVKMTGKSASLLTCRCGCEFPVVEVEVRICSVLFVESVWVSAAESNPQMDVTDNENLWRLCNN